MIEVFISTGHKVLKKNIWMKNYIGEEILDEWDQTVRKSELKRRSYAIFVIVLNLSKMDSWTPVSILAITLSSEVQMRCSSWHWKAKRQRYNFHEDTLYKFWNFQARRRPTRPHTFSSKQLAGGEFRDFQIRKSYYYAFFRISSIQNLYFIPKTSLEALAL